MQDWVFEEQRRAVLRLLAVSGSFALTGGATAQGLGRVPSRLSAGRSVYRVGGDVTVNGVAATTQTVIAAGDTVRTAAGAELVYAVGDDAFLLRGDSEVTMEPDPQSNRLVRGLRVVSGRLLTVFGRRPHRLTTAVATIGIRGTGVYIESDTEQTYACTCYGETELAVTDRPDRVESIKTTRHDSPRYITGGEKGDITPAPFINHTDAELTLLEALVGREPPFGPALGDDYERPRRDRY